jgi:hypothetical protein
MEFGFAWLGHTRASLAQSYPRVRLTY